MDQGSYNKIRFIFLIGKGEKSDWNSIKIQKITYLKYGVDDHKQHLFLFWAIKRILTSCVRGFISGVVWRHLLLFFHLIILDEEKSHSQSQMDVKGKGVF